MKTYIVTGHMRTGTSMMMHALSCGGLDAAYSLQRDQLRKEKSDNYYNPNNFGLYELDNKDYNSYNFPDKFKGKLIKCMWYHLPILTAGKYKIVFMMRDPEEIRQSYIAFFGRARQDMALKYEEQMQVAIERLKQRKDIELEIFNYREVVEDPEKHFNILKEKGWDIDVEKCVSVVDPKLCRYKIENLEIGIK